MFNSFLLLLLSSSLAELPDFSRAGRESTHNIPNIEVSVIDFGGIEGDGKDDSQAFNNAIQSISNTGGVVQIPKGTWKIAKVVNINSNNIRLSGDPSGGTVLHCPNTLTEAYGANKNWSWSGGFIRMSPKGSREELGRIVADSEDGATSVQVQWIDAKPVVGDWVQIWWYNDTGKDTLFKWLYGDEVPKSDYGLELINSTSPRIKSWFKVTAVSDDTMSFDPPLPLPAKPQWIASINRVPHVLGSTIEHLSFEFDYYPYPGHLKELGNNAIACGSSVECEISNIQILNGDSGIFVSNCGFTTVQDIDIQGRYMHHPVSVTSSSHCLVENFVINAPHRHGTTISWASHFNVFRNGRGLDLAMDSHRACSFRNLHKNIVIDCSDKPKQPLRSGGAYDRGLHAARENVYVNIEFQFKGDGPPFQIAYLQEWPMATFLNWYGNRVIVMKPKFQSQTISKLNKSPTPQ